MAVTMAGASGSVGFPTSSTVNVPIHSGRSAWHR
jgi:hypothetical protein